MTISYSITEVESGVCALNTRGLDFLNMTTTKADWRGLPVVAICWFAPPSNFLANFATLTSYPDWDAADAAAEAAGIPVFIYGLIRWATEFLDVPLVSFDIHVTPASLPAPPSTIYDNAVTYYSNYFTIAGTSKPAYVESSVAHPVTMSGPCIVVGDGGGSLDTSFAWDRIATYYDASTSLLPWHNMMFASSRCQPLTLQNPTPRLGAPIYLAGRDNTDATFRRNMDILYRKFRYTYGATTADYTLRQRIEDGMYPPMSTARPGFVSANAPQLLAYSVVQNSDGTLTVDPSMLYRDPSP